MTTQVEQLPNFAEADIPNVKLYGFLLGTPNSQGAVPVSALGEISGIGGSAAQTWDFNFTGAATAKIRANAAMTIAEADTSGTGTVAYTKSTGAAPDTFTATSAPVTLEAGAKLAITVSDVVDHFAVHLVKQ